jgi:hypothetical protein
MIDIAPFQFGYGLLGSLTCLVEESRMYLPDTVGMLPFQCLDLEFGRAMTSSALASASSKRFSDSSTIQPPQSLSREKIQQSCHPIITTVPAQCCFSGSEKNEEYREV